MIFNTISENFPAAMSSAEHFTEFSDQFEGILAGITVRAQRSDFTALHYTALHYTALPHYIALQCTALHCTALCLSANLGAIYTVGDD